MTIKSLFEEKKLTLEMLDKNLYNDYVGYWDKAINFLKSNWDKDLELLSDKQKVWINRIIDDVIEIEKNEKGPVKRWRKIRDSIIK